MQRLICRKIPVRLLTFLFVLAVGVRAVSNWLPAPGAALFAPAVAPIIASGPTMPPGPWDGKPVAVASGPTMPPGPWDGKPIAVASGPTMPPGPWDGKPLAAAGARL
jgi:hypothetical protein